MYLLVIMLLNSKFGEFSLKGSINGVAYACPSFCTEYMKPNVAFIVLMVYLHVVY